MLSQFNVIRAQFFKALLSQSLKAVGTVMTHPKDLHVALTPKANRTVSLTLFAFKDNIMICYWIPKIAMLVLLL